MAIPSIFAPTTIDDLLLVDGGLTNNLPVDVVKDMGADLVIAVDISSPLRERDAVENILNIADQLTRILTGTNTQQSRAMLGEEDILIEPPIGGYSAGNFNEAHTIIPIGESEALRHLDRLQQLALTADSVDINLDAATKSWEPNYLYLGLDMEGDLAGDSLISMSVGYSREEFTDKGAI